MVDQRNWPVRRARPADCRRHRPPTYKPQLIEGSGRTQIIRMVLIVSHTENVELKIDPAVVLATRQYVDESLTCHVQSRNHPDATLTAKGFTQLSSATNSIQRNTLAATPKAVKAAYDLANGKYTALDATTSRKGIVQLSSSIDSISENAGRHAQGGESGLRYG